jgi:hypothetical protein
MTTLRSNTPRRFPITIRTRGRRRAANPRRLVFQSLEDRTVLSPSTVDYLVTNQ